MTTTLEPLRLSKLSNMEFGQLLRRHLSDLATIDQALVTDNAYTNYLNRITELTAIYERALAQIRKSEATDKIAKADDDRDKSLVAFATAIKLHGLSDDPLEAEAARGLEILFNTFKNLAVLSYEAQSIGMDKLISELNSPAYAEKVSYLHMSKYVSRMANTNNEFKTLFSGRIVAGANTENLDMKAIRSELYVVYNDFTDYVLAMAKIADNPLFTTALNLLNTARKYYADQLARHLSTVATAKEKKNTTTE